MLRFQGDRRLPLPPAEAFAKLTDARFLVPCVPDVDAVKVLEPGRAELVLRPGFAFVRGTLEVTMHILDAVAPHAARVELHSKGIGSTSDVSATLAFTPDGDGTAVFWTAEVTKLGGLLKLVPGGLIRGAAEKVINDAWDRIGAALSGPAG
ncbi:MAG: SRPBCC family protein [Gemmataceae bacterium]